MREKYEMGTTGSSSSMEGGRQLWKQVWKAEVPSKVRVFAWKVIRNGLPTRANKKHRHLDHECCCLLCGSPVEDCFHAVISCPHARSLRTELRRFLSLPDEAHIQYTGPDWLLMILNRYDAYTYASFLMLIWRCWMVRNGAIKAGDGISIAGSVAFLTRYSEELLQIRQRPAAADDRGKQKLHWEQMAKEETRQDSKTSKWTPPEARAIKINADGAFSATGAAAAGVIARDDEGRALAATWKCLVHCRDAEEAETWACLEGVRLARLWPDRQVCIESDCAQVIGKVLLKKLDRSLVAPIISEIHTLKFSNFRM
jgi:hypothetical protein